MMVVVVRDGAMFEVLCLNCSDRSPGGQSHYLLCRSASSYGNVNTEHPERPMGIFIQFIPMPSHLSAQRLHVSYRNICHFIIIIIIMFVY